MRPSNHRQSDWPPSRESCLHSPGDVIVVVDAVAVGPVVVVVVVVALASIADVRSVGAQQFHCQAFEDVQTFVVAVAGGQGGA